MLLPGSERARGGRVAGTSPSRRQYYVVLATAAVAVVGVYTAQTYVTVFLTRVSGFSGASLAPVLLVAGVAGVVGVSASGWVMDRRPFGGLVGALVLSAVSLLALYALARSAPAAVVLVAARSLAFGALGIAVQVRVLSVAPGSTDIASAASSSAFNVGIGGGALLGSWVVAMSGARMTALVAGVVAAAAVAVYALEGSRAGTGSPLCEGSGRQGPGCDGPACDGPACDGPGCESAGHARPVRSPEPQRL